MENGKFKTVLFGYDKAQVDAEIEKLNTDMLTLAEESKNKIKQAQNIAMQANALADDMKKELEKIKLELEALKNKN